VEKKGELTEEEGGERAGTKEIEEKVNKSRVGDR